MNHGAQKHSPNPERPFAKAVRLLREAKLRPSQQRLGLAKLLFEGDAPRHITAETLLTEAQAAGIKVSLATVYNTLHGFTDAGLVRAIHVAPGRTLFDTNTAPHHHFYFADEDRVEDIHAQGITIDGLPPAPEGTVADGVDIVVRVRKA